jgi:hypothetical protein
MADPDGLFPWPSLWGGKVSFAGFDRRGVTESNAWEYDVEVYIEGDVDGKGTRKRYRLKPGEKSPSGVDIDYIIVITRSRTTGNTYVDIYKVRNDPSIWSGKVGGSIRMRQDRLTGELFFDVMTGQLQHRTKKNDATDKWKYDSLVRSIVPEQYRGPLLDQHGQ